MSTGGSRLPNLVIAGVSKAGTTSLYWYLSQHPEICRSDTKELRYFFPYRFGGPVAPLSDYARHFRDCGCERYAMEATPGYFYGGGPLIRAMAETLDKPRVLVSLRDPVDRFWSFYRFVRSRARVDADLGVEHYLDICERLRRDGTDRLEENTPYWALSSGFYADFITDWLDALGDRFRVVFFEHLARDPESVVTAVCRWLEIDPDVAPGFEYAVENKTVQYRSKGLQQAALTFNRRTKVFFGRHRDLKRTMRQVYYAVNSDARDRAAPHQETRQRLEAIFAPSNQRLAALLAERGYDDFPGWLTPVRS